MTFSYPNQLRSFMATNRWVLIWLTLFSYQLTNPFLLPANAQSCAKNAFQQEPSDNHDPVLVTNTGITVKRGGLQPITTAQLQVEDPEQAASELTYSVLQESFQGVLTNHGFPVTRFGGTFTQQDIDENRIVYAHYGFDCAAVSIPLSVSDGFNSSFFSVPLSITITPATESVDIRSPYYRSTTKFFSSDPDALFGTCLAVDEDTAVIANSTVQGVHVFTQENGIWTDSASLVCPDPFYTTPLTVSISGDTVVVGSPGTQYTRGTVYVFTKPEGGWKGEILPSAILAQKEPGKFNELPNPVPPIMRNMFYHEQFGFTVSVSGDVIAVGTHANVTSPITNISERIVYVYTKPDGGWSGTLTESAQLKATDGSGGSFGTALSIDKETIVVSAPNFETSPVRDTGIAYIFTMPSEGWKGIIGESARLTTSDTERQNFGDKVSISGETVVISAPGFEFDYEGTRTGSAYVYVKPAAGWHGTLTENARLRPLATQRFDHFGASVSVSEDLIAVGCLNKSYIYSGSVYLYTKPANGWQGNLLESFRINDNDPGINKGFGYMVGLLGSTLFAGSRNGFLAGPIYVFTDPTFLAAHNNLIVNKGGSNTLTKAHLNSTSSHQPTSSIVYTITTPPMFGTLRKNGVELHNHETFTQDDVDTLRVSYTHNNVNQAADGFSFHVSDGMGVIPATFAIAIHSTDTPPHLVPYMPFSLSENQPFSHTLFAEDEDTSLSSLAFTCLSKPDWLTFTPLGNGQVTLSGTPPRNTPPIDGQGYTVLFDIFDGTTHVPQEYYLYVGTVYDPPTYQTQPNPNAYVNIPYEYHASATDEEGSEVVVTAPLKPDWLQVSDSGNGFLTLRGVPSGSDLGEHWVRLEASDGVLGTTQAFVITVHPQATPTSTTTPTDTPTITPTATTTPTATSTPTPIPLRIEVTDPHQGYRIKLHSEEVPIVMLKATSGEIRNAILTLASDSTDPAGEHAKIVTKNKQQIWVKLGAEEVGFFRVYVRFNDGEVAHEIAWDVYDPDATPTATITPTSSPEPFATGTPQPTATATPTIAPTPTHSIDPTPTPQASPLTVMVLDDLDLLDVLGSGHDSDPAEERMLIIGWQPAQPEAVGYHVYVRIDDSDTPLYLGRSGGADQLFLVWQEGWDLLAPEFQAGPQFGHTYRFLLYPQWSGNRVDPRSPYTHAGSVRYVETETAVRNWSVY